MVFFYSIIYVCKYYYKMSVSFISLFKPLCGIVPEVEKPKNKQSISTNEKIVWTGITLFIYLVCC